MSDTPRTNNRTRKAEKISAILKDFCDGELANYSCLDLGCSEGVISAQLTSLVSSVVGIDTDAVALRNALKAGGHRPDSPRYILGTGYSLPFREAEFNVVVCAQVYEHVAQVDKMIAEITRVLKPGGICFFSGPNRLAIMEEHYWLPFLSWLPREIASFYMRLMKRGQVYDIYPLTYWQLKRKWVNWKIVDYSLKLLRQPHAYFVDERVDKHSIIKHLPDSILKVLTPYFPNYNWIIIKPE